VTDYRNGARVLLDAAVASGIRICFANPGTTELTLVRALEDVPEVRPVLGLFEGVCTGAADGYARVSGSPALTLLHLGPGLANGLANLHNARRAHSPIINIIGDHAMWHLPFDAPLTSDIAGLARPMSDVMQLNSPDTIQKSVRTAIERVLTPPCSIVTLIAPSDVMDARVAAPFTETSAVNRPARKVPSERIAEAAARVARSPKLVLLLGGDALTERGQRAAERIANKTGARLIMESYPAIVSLGGDLPQLERLAYFPQDVLAQLADSTVVLSGARAPVSYFGYPDQPSELVSPADRLFELAAAGEDSVLALEQLADLVKDSKSSNSAERHTTLPLPSSGARDAQLTPIDVAEELVEQIPEDTIISLEGSTCGGPYLQRAHRARRHRVMTNTGGAIGQGIPCAVGAALAAPDARVVCLQSDGSAQYTLQALWTLAREQLNVTVVICANHRYGILQTELSRAGAQLNTPVTDRMTRLGSPRLDWLALARGYGVPAMRATTAAEFQTALSRGLRVIGPYLIEAHLP
jgi:acetolactate synthase I/II/III large subunit